jgi:hypothetical protein
MKLLVIFKPQMVLWSYCKSPTLETFRIQSNFKSPTGYVMYQQFGYVMHQQFGYVMHQQFWLRDVPTGLVK